MQRVDLEVADGIAVLTVNDPDTRNSLTVEMADQMIAACERIDSDPSVAVTIVEGAAATFCSGAHRDALATFGEDPAHPDNYHANGRVYAAFHRVGKLACPTIAAVRGSAVGAGLNLMLATDLRIVAEGATILSGFARIGLHPGGGHFVLVARVAGPEVASAMAIFGERIDGRRAAEVGLAWRAVPDADVEAVTRDLAQRVASQPALAREAVHTLRSTVGPPMTTWDVALQAERASQMRSLRQVRLS